jgi:hypothetical protein
MNQNAPDLLGRRRSRATFTKAAIVKQTGEIVMTTLPTKPKSEVDLILEAASKGPTPLLKFKKTKFEIGDQEVPLGTQFIAYCTDWRQGWVKFIGDEKVDERIGRVADGFHPPERDELGDTDQEEWEPDDDGKLRDPWVFQQYLPLENVKTGERYLFVSSSKGGGIGVEILCHHWAKDIDKGLHRGLPIVKLATGSFHTKKYGAIQRPDFPIVSWPDDDLVAPRIKVVPSLGLADDENEGPPDLYDPEDPHYDR